jgi:oligo-1,6-glucosidase
MIVSEVDMVFFNHVQQLRRTLNWGVLVNKFDLSTHKMIMNDWQQALATDGWNSYLSNHESAASGLSIWQ